MTATDSPSQRRLRGSALALVASWVLCSGGTSAQGGASVVDFSPTPPPFATWPVFVDIGDSVGSPGTNFVDLGTSRGAALVDLVGPDPSDPSALDKVGPPDGIPDLLQVNSNSPGLPLSAGPGQWLQPPVGTEHSGNLLLRTELNGDRTDVTALVSPFDPDGFSMEYPGGSPWGAIAADYDGDGDQDVYFPCGGFNLDGPNNLMRNEGDGTFRNVSASAGIAHEQATFAATWFDYDRDGDLDFYEANAGTSWANFQGSLDAKPDDRLYQNQGDGSFVEVGEEAEVDLRSNSFSCATSDLDRDGWPDLVVSCFRQLNKAFYNNGDGTFTFMAPAQNEDVDLTLAGAMGPDPSFAGVEELLFVPPGFGDLLPLNSSRTMPVVVEDFNADGWPDIFFTAWSRQIPDAVTDGASGAFFSPWSPAALYLNRGDQDGDGLGDGFFREVANEVGIRHVGGCMGLLAGDFNGDGFMDAYLGGGGPDLAGHLEEDYLYINDGSAWPRNFQSDPDQPLSRAFFEVGALAGTYANLNMSHGVIGTRTASGRLDVAVGSGGPAIVDGGQPNFYWSNTGNENGVEPRFLEVELVPEGVVETGARLELVRITAAGVGRRVVRERASGQAFATHDAGPVLFGLGDATPLLVRAQWPSGMRGGRLLWPPGPLVESMTLVEPEVSIAVNLTYPQPSGVQLSIEVENKSGAPVLRRLFYAVLTPLPGGALPALVVPLGPPLLLPPGAPIQLNSGVLAALPAGLQTLVAAEPVTGAIKEVDGDWHDPVEHLDAGPSGLAPPTDLGESEDTPTWTDAMQASRATPSEELDVLVVGRKLELVTDLVRISPAWIPYDWEDVDLTGAGSLALPSGDTLRWSAGRVTLEVVRPASVSLSFNDGYPVVGTGGAQGCCDLRDWSTERILRFDRDIVSIVADGVHYSPEGERLSE